MENKCGSCEGGGGGGKVTWYARARTGRRLEKRVQRTVGAGGGAFMGVRGCARERASERASENEWKMRYYVSDEKEGIHYPSYFKKVA